MIDSQGVPLVISERKPIEYMRDGDSYKLRLVLADADRFGPAGYALPGGGREPVKERALRVAEAISKAIAGY